MSASENMRLDALLPRFRGKYDDDLAADRGKLQLVKEISRTSQQTLSNANISASLLLKSSTPWIDVFSFPLVWLWYRAHHFWAKRREVVYVRTKSTD